MESLHTFTATAASALDAVWRDEAAMTAIEYSLMAALLTIICVAAMNGAGDGLIAVFNALSRSLAAAALI